jgi:hypothetical protein
MDTSRDVTDNIDFGVGVIAENLGRSRRRPLEARVGLRPVTSANGNHEIGSPVPAIGALLQGHRLTIVMRVTGRFLIAATDVKRE